MVRLAIAFGMTLAATIGLHVYAAFNWAALYTHLCYASLDLLYLTQSFQLLLLAFCLVRRPTAQWHAILGRGLLLVSTSLFLLATVDAYIIAFRCDTSGPGGIQCFTHFNWYKQYARSNQLGYWERDLTPFMDANRPSQQRVIAAVGDSWTWGQGVRGKQHRFTNVLEGLLHTTAGQSVAVLNFGRAGADTKEEITIVNDAAKVRPDIVLIGYLANDIDRYAPMQARPVTIPSVEKRLIYASPTCNFLYWRVRAPHASVNDFGNDYARLIVQTYDDPSVMEKHLHDIEALIARVRETKATPVFVILPFPTLWLEDPNIKSGSAKTRRQIRDQTYQAIAQKVRSLNVPVIEAQRLEDEMSIAEFALNPMDAHPNETAHRRIAEVIADEFTKQKLLEK